MYVDTSCLVAYYIPEPKSEAVEKRLKKADRVSISQLTDIELLSSLNKKVRMREISETKLNKVYSLYQKHKSTKQFQYLLFKEEYMKAAETILKQTRHPLRSLDAIHLGIIYSEEFTLFSFDTVMNETAREFNIPVIPI